MKVLVDMEGQPMDITTVRRTMFVLSNTFGNMSKKLEKLYWEMHPGTAHYISMTSFKLYSSFEIELRNTEFPKQFLPNTFAGYPLYTTPRIDPHEILLCSSGELLVKFINVKNEEQKPDEHS